MKYKDIFVVLIMLPIYLIVTYVIKQRNWRTGCIALVCNFILGYAGSFIGEKVAIWIYSLRIPLAIIASLNFYIWFKSDGKTEELILPRTKLNKLMILGGNFDDNRNFCVLGYIKIMKKITIGISVIAIIFIAFIMLKYFLYISEVSTEAKRINKILEKFEGEINDEIYDLRNVEEILPYLSSKKITDVRATISALKFIDDNTEKIKAIRTLEDLWINGFRQYAPDETAIIDYYLKQIRIELAAALYRQTNQNKYLIYLKKSSNSKDHFERDSAKTILADLNALGSDAVPKQANEINSESKKYIAIWETNPIQNSFDLAYLRNRYRSGNHNIRMTIIKHLGYFKSEGVRTLLIEIWNSIDKNTEDNNEFYEKMHAAVSLWKIEEKEYMDFVYNQLKSNSIDKRTQAALLLGMVNTEKSRKRLLDLVLNDKRLPPAFAAASSLSDIGTLDMIPILEKAKERNLGNLDEAIQRAIENIIERYKEENKRQKGTATSSEEKANDSW